jgi:hypothetical protein
MSAAPDLFAGPALVGWRSWRVMSFQRLGEPDSIRLCACGTNGLPKVWEPRQAMRAVCGKFNSTHDAPWEDCHCGFYAYREKSAAEDHLATFADSNGKRVLGWAFGRVSLWGRIVEHVDGWRAEYAYPYEVTVFGSPALANQVRSVYGIDVEARSIDDLPSPPDDDEIDDPPVTSAVEVRKLLTEAERLLQQLERSRGGKPRTPKYLSDVLRDSDDITSALRNAYDRDEALTARERAVAAMVAAGATEYEPRITDTCSLAADLYKLAMRREARKLTGPKGETRWIWTYGDLPTDCRENDPTLDHVDRDVRMAVALYRAAGLKAATAKTMVASLSEMLGDPQTSARWSGTFVRLQLRGWATSPEDRTYMLTDYGAAVAKRGADIPKWPGHGERGDELVLTELRAAAAAAGGFVDFYELARRFRNGGWWNPNGHPGGHQVAQRLLGLQRAGLVETDRRRDSTRLLYRDRKVETINAC